MLIEGRGHHVDLSEVTSFLLSLPRLEHTKIARKRESVSTLNSSLTNLCMRERSIALPFRLLLTILVDHTIISFSGRYLIMVINLSLTGFQGTNQSEGAAQLSEGALQGGLGIGDSGGFEINLESMNSLI